MKTLEEKGFTYRAGDGIYFDTSKLKDYGKLARLNRDNLLAGARIELREDKKNPTDFALWKFSPTDAKRLMEWESPWGIGFPGWHLECSAMSTKFLGEEIDIHCGGVDHIMIHHTNEIAQCEAAFGHDWVRWWMHSEFLVLPSKEEDGEAAKMAKSGGNFITVDRIVEEGHDPLAYRLFCLGAHYRAPLTFTREGLESAGHALDRLRNRVIALDREDGGSVSEKHYEPFWVACTDDLNTPRALAALWGLLRDEDVNRADKYATLLAMDTVLGLGIDQMEEEKADLDDGTLALVEQREEARKRKDFAEADRIRDQLLAAGIMIEDTPEGPKVHRK